MADDNSPLGDAMDRLRDLRRQLIAHRAEAQFQLDQAGRVRQSIERTEVEIMKLGGDPDDA